MTTGDRPREPLAGAGGDVRRRGGRAGGGALRRLRLQPGRRHRGAIHAGCRTATISPSIPSRPVVGAHLSQRRRCRAGDDRDHPAGAVAPRAAARGRRAGHHRARGRGLGQRLESALQRSSRWPPRAGEGALARLRPGAGRGRRRARSRHGLRHRTASLDAALDDRHRRRARRRETACSTSASAPASWRRPLRSLGPARSMGSISNRSRSVRRGRMRSATGSARSSGWRQGASATAGRFQGQYDLVVANIIARILIELAPGLASGGPRRGNPDSGRHHRRQGGGGSRGVRRAGAGT